LAISHPKWSDFTELFAKTFNMAKKHLIVGVFPFFQPDDIKVTN
jgi:hypothetical protein